MGNRPSSVQSTYPRHGPPWPLHGPPSNGLPSRHPHPHQQRFGSAPPRPQSLYERSPYSFVSGPQLPVNQRITHPHPPPQLRRSQMSLNGADSGYMTSPGDSDRAKRASRLSLHEFAYDARPIIVADPKTLKKLEKRHKKMLKKMGARAPPMAFAPGPIVAGPLPPPQMGPMIQPSQFQRAMSFDDINRRHIDIDRAQKEAWAEQMRRPQMSHPRVESTSTAARSSSGRGSLSPSPLTTSSPFASSPSQSQNTVDGWTDHRRSNRSVGIERPRDQGRPNESRERTVPVQVLTRTRPVSPPIAPLYEATRPTGINSKLRNGRDRDQELLQELNRSPAVLRERVHNIERVEKRISTCTYAQPIPRDRNSHLTETGYSSSRSSVSGVPRGDQSEIDFSWVRDEEKKLNDKAKIIKRDTGSLPEFYFGMEPPKIGIQENQETLTRRENISASPRVDADIRTKLAFFEKEAREAENERRKSMAALSSSGVSSSEHSSIQRSSLHDSHGPAERRLQRISRNLEAQQYHDQQRSQNHQEDRKWRSSIAF